MIGYWLLINRFISRSTSRKTTTTSIVWYLSHSLSLLSILIFSVAQTVQTTISSKHTPSTTPSSEVQSPVGRPSAGGRLSIHSPRQLHSSSSNTPPTNTGRPISPESPTSRTPMSELSFSRPSSASSTNSSTIRPNRYSTIQRGNTLMVSNGGRSERMMRIDHTYSISGEVLFMISHSYWFVFDILVARRVHANKDTDSYRRLWSFCLIDRISCTWR